MPENYKKWVLTGIALVVSIVAILILFPPELNNRGAANSGLQPPPPPPQYTDLNQLTTMSVEELGLDSGDPHSLASTGDYYFENGNYLQAIEIYKRVLEINQNDVDTFNDLGLAYHYSGSSDLAVETLKKGTEIDPEFQRIWLSLGYVLKSVKMIEEAGPALQKAIDLAPDNVVGQEAARMLAQ